MWKSKNQHRELKYIKITWSFSQGYPKLCWWTAVLDLTLDLTLYTCNLIYILYICRGVSNNCFDSIPNLKFIWNISWVGKRVYIYIYISHYYPFLGWWISTWSPLIDRPSGSCQNIDAWSPLYLMSRYVWKYNIPRSQFWTWFSHNIIIVLCWVSQFKAPPQQCMYSPHIHLQFISSINVWLMFHHPHFFWWSNHHRKGIWSLEFVTHLPS